MTLRLASPLTAANRMHTPCVSRGRAVSSRAEGGGIATERPRLLYLLLLGIVFAGIPANADLKALFAFDDKIVSIRFPEFTYTIVTTVNEQTRLIAVGFPRSKLEDESGSSPPHLEIVLESVSPTVDGQNYHEHYVERYVDETGAASEPTEDFRKDASALSNCSESFLFFNDGELRAHKALLITSVNDRVGVVILLDTIAETYDVNREGCMTILHSIRFE